MMDQKLSPMQEVFKTLIDLHEHLLNSDHYRELKSGVVTTLSGVSRMTRFYSVSDKRDLETIWGRFRGNVDATQYLLDVTARFHQALTGTTLDFNRLIDVTADALGSNRGESADNDRTASVIDRDLVERLPVNSEIRVLLQNNPWFLTLYLSSTLWSSLRIAT